ncbi:phosphatase PAP2 family protein [Rheinheimera riviphila]|uniref:Phosphatase PAP2 family protein n=1 Tax=Rheinheimera riviphila TaxID=1834037 RepID=A0A437QR97_9GAMM|nr:phosphatase PAP2 family protein [Rheinheimera riviphila]RVU37030.1 phosphatase PAP2 family protein [Rheinheimera riviphila]
MMPPIFGQQQHWQTTVFVPLALLSLAFVLAYGAGVDQVLASWFYQLQGGQWQLKQYWLTETLLHQAVRQLNQLVVLSLLLYWLSQAIAGKRSIAQRALGLLLFNLVLCFTSIAVLKKLIPMECPWDLQQFGGTHPFIGLFSPRPASMAANQCFPAGHASIGYSWLASYYFLLVVRPSLAKTGLWCCISLGLLLGFTQQLRGAHFISHDIATAAICWLIASLNVRWFYRLYPQESTDV